MATEAKPDLATGIDPRFRSRLPADDYQRDDWRRTFEYLGLDEEDGIEADEVRAVVAERTREIKHLAATLPDPEPGDSIGLLNPWLANLNQAVMHLDGLLDS